MSKHNVRVLIADDEGPSRLRMRQMLASHPRYLIVAECSDGIEAVDAILRDQPDVIFLDITMPALNGLEVADAVSDAELQIVFVTAHERFAHRAFDADAVDYLVKPISQARFDKMIERLERRMSEPRAASSAHMTALMQHIGPERSYLKRFLVRTPQGHYFVAAEDVEWLEAEGNYVVLHARKERHVVRQTLKALESRLDPDAFARVHRSAIVNTALIDRLEPLGHGEYTLILRSGASVDSSRSYSQVLQRILQG